MIEDNQKKTEKLEKPQNLDEDEEEDYSDDQNDPDLQEAIEISKQDCPDQGDQKSDDNSDEGHE